MVAEAAAASLPVAVGRVDGARAIGVVADSLQANGLRLQVSGPDGPLLVLGREQHSRTGRWLTGSAHVRPGQAKVLAPLLAAEAATRGRALARPAAVVIGASAALLVIGRWLRPLHRPAAHNRPRRRSR